MSNSNIDLSYLIDITGGDSDMMAEMIDLFLIDTEKGIGLLQDYCKQGDWKALASEAHRLKPTFLYVGLLDLNHLAQELETNARNAESVESYEGSIQVIFDRFESAKPRLKELLREYSRNT